MRPRGKKFAAVAGIFIGSVLISAVAFGWYSVSSSSGGGTADAAALATVTVEAAVEGIAPDPDDALYPGDVSNVVIVATAPAGWPDARRARIGSASASVDASSLPAGCEAVAADFVFTPAAFTPGFVLGSLPFEFNAGTIEFVDTAEDQSCAAGATLTLNATVGP